MTLSAELQTGKAAEHLVCADLILQGLNAFLADQGLPYDVVVDDGSRLLRVQVKSASRPMTAGRSGSDHRREFYRWNFRRAKRPKRVSASEIDYAALVALDVRMIAYVPVAALTRPNGLLVSGIEMRAKHIQVGREYSNGSRRTLVWGRNMEDFAEFVKEVKDHGGHTQQSTLQTYLH